MISDSRNCSGNARVAVVIAFRSSEGEGRSGDQLRSVLATGMGG